MIEVQHSRFSTLVFHDEPHLCPQCQAMHYWFKNVNGATTCVGCAVEKRAATS